jgi:hypothetical protein
MLDRDLGGGSLSSPITKAVNTNSKYYYKYFYWCVSKSVIRNLFPFSIMVKHYKLRLILKVTYFNGAMELRRSNLCRATINVACQVVAMLR